MAARTPTVTDMSYAELVRGFRPASYHFGDTWCPAVCPDKSGGWQIRIVKSETRSSSSANVTYDYFYLYPDGLINTSPRGYAKDYTRRVRVTDIAEVAKAQETPDPNAPRFSLGF